MNSTKAIRLSQADDQGVGNRLLSRSSAVMVAVVVLAAIVFFSNNPFRVGEITVTTPDGSSVKIQVANSNEFSELIEKGLENEKTRGYVANSLLNVIENLPAGSKLGEKLVELAELRDSPFKFHYVPVIVVYNPNLPAGVAAVCEESAFSGKTIVVRSSNDPHELSHVPIRAYADARIVFPCPDGREVVQLNSKEALQFDRDKVMAKRDL